MKKFRFICLVAWLSYLPFLPVWSIFLVSPLAAQSFGPGKVKEAFEALTPPPAPDYSLPKSWSCLPTEYPGVSLNSPKGWPEEAPRPSGTEAEVDVFYVYPTVYRSSKSWNAPLDKKSLNRIIDNFPVKHQATPFSPFCNVYVPRYRQATLWAFVDTTGNGTKALTLGLDDVERAFRYYIEHLNKGRPFILAGHSQGSYQLLRLLRERLTSEADQDVLRRMVAAYLVGLPTHAGWLQAVPFCETPNQTGCWCTWNSFHASVKDDNPSLPIFRQPKAVNPVTFTTLPDTAKIASLPGRVNLLYRYKSNPPEIRVWVSNGIVRVGTRKLLNPKFLGGVDYHVIDYNLFYEPLQRNVQERIAAWYSRQQLRIN